MSNNDELWKHLKESGIESCSKNDDVEIDMHEIQLDHDVVHSYFFDCLSFSNGIKLCNVFVKADMDGNVIVEPNEILFDITQTMNANARIEQLISILMESLRGFLQNRGDLT